jgi:hypothetical protein
VLSQRLRMREEADAERIYRFMQALGAAAAREGFS